MLMETKIFMKSAGTRGYSRLARVMTAIVMMFTLATTGAWADGTVYTKAVAVSDLKQGDILAEGFSLTGSGFIAFADGRYTAVGTTYSSLNMTYYTGTGKNAVITASAFGSDYSFAPKDEKGNAGNAWLVTAKSNSDVTFAGITYAAEPGKYTVAMAAEAGEGWTIEPAEATTTGVDKDTKITATYSGTKHVKSVTAVTKAAEPAVSYDKTVSINDGAVTVTAGEHWLVTGTGMATSNQITISDGAKVTLDGATISGDDFCIKCNGSATIILKDGTTNTLTSSSDAYPALWAGDAGTTLTIQGSTGALTVQSGEWCAGIGGGYKNTNSTCGNIRIEGGVITATGGQYAAGIGTDCGIATCGNIDITGGTIVATGGIQAAGIGSGHGGEATASCGNITIKKTVTSVTATKGSNAPNSIGAGDGSNASCGTVTIEDGANVTQN